VALISSYSTLFLYDLPFFIQFPGLILATATELHQGASAAAANRERDHVSRRQWGGRPRGHQRGLAFRHLAQVAGRQSLPLREGHQAAAYNSLYVNSFFFVLARKSGISQLQNLNKGQSVHCCYVTENSG
jgi:hypothetical protein